MRLIIAKCLESIPFSYDHSFLDVSCLRFHFTAMLIIGVFLQFKWWGKKQMKLCTGNFRGFFCLNHLLLWRRTPLLFFAWKRQQWRDMWLFHWKSWAWSSTMVESCSTMTRTFQLSKVCTIHHFLQYSVLNVSVHAEIEADSDIIFWFDFVSEEISALRSRQRHLDHRRQEALDKLIDLKGTVHNTR